MFCRNCGNKLQEGDKFCSVCGAKVPDDGELNIANEKSAVPNKEEPAFKMTWNEEKEVKKSTEDVPKMHWEAEEERPKRTTNTHFEWAKEEGPREPRKTSEGFNFDWSSVVDDKERKASKKIPAWRKSTVTNPENFGQQTKSPEEEDFHYVKTAITNPEPEDFEMNRLDKQYEPVEELEIDTPKEPTRDVTKDEISGAIYDNKVQATKEIPAEPELHYVKTSITDPDKEDYEMNRLDKQYEPVEELEIDTPKEPIRDVTKDEISGDIYDAEYVEPEVKKEVEIETVDYKDEYIDEEIADPEPEDVKMNRLDNQYEPVAVDEVDTPREPVKDLFGSELDGANFDVVDKDLEEVTDPEVRPGDVLDEPEYISPFDESDDLDNELKELEHELFAEMEDNFVDEKATIKVDKFYTLDKKSEEFQQLLDNEYDKIKNKGVNYDLMEPDENMTDSKAYEPTDFAIGSMGTAEAYGLDEEFYVEEPEEEKKVQAKKDVEILEEDEDEEPVKKKSHGFLKFLVVLLLIMVLFEVFVLAMNNFAPDSSITQMVNDGIRQVTKLITSQSVDSLIGRC